MSQKVRPLCFSAFALLHSGVTRSALWSAEHLTRESVRSARSLDRQNLFHAEAALPVAERSELSARIRDAEHRAQELACELAVARARIADLTGQNAVSGDGFAEPDVIRPEAVAEVSEAPGESAEGNDHAAVELNPAAKRQLANELWDRVMIEVQALMRRLSQVGQESFRAAELLVYLPKELLDEAERRHENLTASVLSSRMATRAKYKRFFVKEPDRAAFTLLEGYQHAG